MAAQDEIRLRRALGGTPSATIFHGSLEEDPVHRTVINESRISASDWDWPAAESGVERELPRGLIVARELSGAGRYVCDAQGTLLVANGDAGDITLRVYASASTDPVVALGSATLLLTHTVAIANPGVATSVGGVFNWTLMLLPSGQADASSVQTYLSTLVYQRWSNGTPDALNTSQTTGQLAWDARTADWIIMQSITKAAGLVNSRIKVFSIDSFVRNGQSGQA